MAKLTYSAETSVPPEAVAAAARDFTEHRPEVWPHLDRAYYEVTL